MRRSGERVVHPSALPWTAASPSGPYVSRASCLAWLPHSSRTAAVRRDGARAAGPAAAGGAPRGAAMRQAWAVGVVEPSSSVGTGHEPPRDLLRRPVPRLLLVSRSGH
eukprot:1324144-Prymnesium_polylepis.1